MLNLVFNPFKMGRVSFKERLKKLPVSKKFVLIGSMLGVICVFLPWYKDIDRFNTGDMFLGITGPLYLSGIIVLAASSISLSLIAFKLFDKEPPKLPIKHEHFYVFSASLSLLMLVLSMSVFFHTKFGINITDKNMGVGMIGEFFAVGISLFGGLMSLRKKKVSFEEEGNLDPLIDLKVQDRVQHTLEEEKNESIQDPQQERISVFENEDSITNEIK